MKSVDYISLQRALMVHPSIEHACIELLIDCESTGIPIRYVSTYRTFNKQNQLYAKGRSSPGNIVTWARGGFSFHNYGLAIDFCLLLKNGEVSWNMGDDNNFDGVADWMQVVKLAKKLGFKWGGDWKDKKKKDYPHFQLTHGLTIDECKNRLDKGLCDKNGYIFIT